MANRTTKVTLTAQVQGYVDGMKQAAQATRETGTESEKLTQKKADFQALGQAMVAVGGAITAVGVAALKTGIDYNSMQQTSRAALKTMLGSAEAVNAQMNQLDDFARNSPFSKQTFITAQQQMLAFGIEAKKVIPYLDSIQDAVAAAGGSNQQIGEIAFIMAQISSASKITAQDLMQFGQRGINAAELIGSQMGKTGAQIREDITAGTLDADRALDALASGMKERFGGAAANVKETFDGAMDRVKAAWRDFSAELAKPLVDPEGGGALVDFLNTLADAMRAFEKLPEPVKNTITALTGLTGALLLAGGTAILAIPKYVELKGALEALQITAGRASGALASVAPAALAIAVGYVAAEFVSWMDDVRGVTTSAEDLEKQLRETGAAGSDLERGLTGGSAFRGIGLDAEIAANNLRTLNTGIGQVKAWFDNSFLGQAMSMPFLGLGREAGNAQKQIEELDAAMASMVASGDTDAAAEAYEYFAAQAKEAGWSAERIAEALPEYTEAVKNAAPATKTSADLASDAASAYTDQANAAKAATDELFKLVDALMESNSVAQTAEGANARYQETLASVAEYVANAQAGLEGYSASLDENTVEGSKNREMLAGLASDSQSAAAAIYQQELQTLGVDQATANYRSRLEQGRQALYDQILAMTGNADAAQALTDKIYAMPSEKDIQILIDTATATSQLDTFIANAPKVLSIQGQIDWAQAQMNPFSWQNVAYSANGNMFAYANGGIESYASGGFPTGIYSGGAPIHKFAEPETGWEAYISGKADQRDRNRQIWVDAGERLGMGDVLKAAQASNTYNITVQPAPGMDEDQLADRVIRKLERRL